ncbi:MAG: cytochrome C [Deltaproteobacteria bacterium]|nr:cytochrome C [Deltaproteobacteria bacterium]
MGLRDRWWIVFSVALLGGVVLGSVAWSEGPFKLKPGGMGKVCVVCHSDLEDKLKSPFVHTPVKAGRCEGCHNPHASAFGKLLSTDPARVCVKCHASLIPEGAKSVHTVVVQGACVKCHDPHAAPNKANLLTAGNDLCLGCHKAIADKVQSAKFSHDPVKEGCLNCHNPHASSKAEALLTEAVPELCVQCHEVGAETFVKRHGGYPVGRARCTTCHDPHGSDLGGLLLANSHKPVANKQCTLCHVDPSSDKPFATKKKGVDLCKGCHSSMINDAFGKKRLHGALLGEKGCATCHSAHASKEKSLLKEPQLKLCQRCHSDTIERQRKSPTPHQPVAQGECTACHAAHASDNTYLMPQADTKELCGKCHEWQKHSTHPIGDKVVDLRNRNLTVQCNSCHRSHGTEFKHMFYFSTVSELCTQCHTQYQR